MTRSKAHLFIYRVEDAGEGNPRAPSILLSAAAKLRKATERKKKNQGREGVNLDGAVYVWPQRLVGDDERHSRRWQDPIWLPHPSYQPVHQIKTIIKWKCLLPQHLITKNYSLLDISTSVLHTLAWGFSILPRFNGEQKTFQLVISGFEWRATNTIKSCVQFKTWIWQ